MSDNNSQHNTSKDNNLFLTSSIQDQHQHPPQTQNTKSHLIKYSLIVPKQPNNDNSFLHSNHNRNHNNIHIQTEDASVQSNIITDRQDFISFPIIPLNNSVDNESFNYSLTHPDKPINISHKINFRANPKLVKGNVLSNSVTCCQSILDKPLEMQQVRAPGYFLRNAYWIIKGDFNKIKDPKDNKKFDMVNHLSPRERRLAEIQSRKVFKYKEKEKLYKFRKDYNKFNNNEKIVIKAKDIIIEKLPRIKGLGYQGYGTEKKECSGNSDDGVRKPKLHKVQIV
jgi:hypothetical protein